MALIFLESFDDGAEFPSSYTANKWDLWFSINSSSVSTSYGRNGRGAQLDGNNEGQGQFGRLIVPSQTEYIVGTALYYNDIRGSGVWYFRSGGTQQVRIEHTIYGEVVAKNGDGTELGRSATGVIKYDIWQYMEMRVRVHDTTGQVEIMVDGTQVLNLSSQDTRNGTPTDITQICMAGAANRIYVDDIYVLDVTGGVNDSFLGDIVVEALVPDADGNYTDFTAQGAGSHYVEVDEAPDPDGDTTYVESGTVSDTDSWGFEAMAASSGATVHGVQLGTQARHTGAGGTYRHMHRRSATDDFGASKTPASAFSWQGEVWDQDPQAGPGAWTVANVDASEFGVDIVT